MRVFLAILEHGSLSAAGRELGMTQPAVSNHLHALEERFGLALLSRGKPLKPTPAGECLARHARRVLDELAGLEADMACHAAPRGGLVVGASSTPAELLIPRLAVRFSSRYPDVALRLRVYDTDEAVEALLNREVEVAIVGRLVDHPCLEVREVGQDELIPVVAAGDRLAGTEISPADLAGCPFILRERGSATRQVVEESLATLGITPKVVMELGSNAAVAGAVAEGAGVGIVPARTVHPDSHVRRLAVRGITFRRPFVLAFERGHPLSPAAEAFIATCTGEEGDL